MSSKQIKWLRVLLGQVSGMGALGLYYWGDQYITEGHGLNPILAGALLAVYIICPYLIDRGKDSD